ncbi:hypothetical protein ACWDQL_03650 [Streptomyces olivaceus]
MLQRSRLISSVGAVALAAGALTATATVPSSAASAVAQSCYGSANYFSTTQVGERHVWPANGWARTTSACNDINVKTIALPRNQVWVCFKRTGCQIDDTDTYSGTWVLAATNVLDGTDYKLMFAAYDVGQVAD